MLLHLLRHSLKETVPRVVAEPVVHLLEVITVHISHGHRVPVSSGPVHLNPHPFIKSQTVCKASEEISPRIQLFPVQRRSQLTQKPNDENKIAEPDGGVPVGDEFVGWKWNVTRDEIVHDEHSDNRRNREQGAGPKSIVPSYKHYRRRIEKTHTNFIAGQGVDDADAQNQGSGDGEYCRF